MTDDPRPMVKRVYFSVRTQDDATLAEVTSRVNGMLNLSLVPDTTPQYERLVMSTSVLGLRITLGTVKSMQGDAPQRFQLSARQQFDDRGHDYEQILHIDGWLLHVLEQHEPGRWYRPSPFEGLIDTGVKDWKVQDVWAAIRRSTLGGLRQAPPER